MLHILYKTTNNINKKVYIGVHSTSHPNDSYLGSGYALNNAIKKYGRENFTREILSTYRTREKAFKEETKIVNEKWVDSKSNYNISIGGSGRRGPNSRSKPVCVYDNDLNFIKLFETKTAVAEFLEVSPVYIFNACKNAAQGKACRVGNHYVCHEEDQPRKKDTSYLKKQARKMQEQNRGRKRPKHSKFIRERNLNRPCNHIVYNWEHESGIKFTGTRRGLIDAFPKHYIKNGELGVLIKGKYKSHRGWLRPRGVSKDVNMTSPRNIPSSS